MFLIKYINNSDNISDIFNIIFGYIIRYFRQEVRGMRKKITKIAAMFMGGAVIIGSSQAAALNVASASEGKFIPSSAGEFNGHYYFVYKDVKTWEEAKAACESRGGHLATITSKEEDDFVYSYIKESGYDNAYFGLSDSETEGTWVNVTGEEVSYTNWAACEPSAENDNEDYAMYFWMNDNGKWNDGDFQESLMGGEINYICEWDDASGIEQTITIPDDAFEYGEHKYYIYEDAQNWNMAQMLCEMKGGYLATITTKEENDVLFRYIKSKGYDNAYFGLSDSEEEGIWKKVTGEESAYTNWAEGEPNEENDNENYAMFYWKNEDGRWNDGDFGGTTVNGGVAYICEWGSERSPQTITVSGKAAKTVQYKQKNLKKKSASFSLDAKADSKLSYKVTSGSSKYITVSKDGKITLKKGCKKGTYKILISAEASDTFDSASKIINIQVK